MHPQLEAKRFNSCADFIKALDECHKRSFYEKMFGVCNNEKDALTACLKQARRQGTIDAMEAKKIKRDHIQKKWDKQKEEEYGEDVILKKILERHNLTEEDLRKD